jgi:hypothetical protein
MRALVCKITLALAVGSGYAAAVSCGDDGGGNPDGGGGSGGAGGSGAMDAGDSGSGTVGCLKMEEIPLTCPTPPVTFDNVKSIFQTRCSGVCHNGATLDGNGIPIWALTDRQHILDWHDTVRSTIGDCQMPPPDAGVPVTIEERKAIIQFVRCEGPK